MLIFLCRCRHRVELYPPTDVGRVYRYYAGLALSCILLLMLDVCLGITLG